mgnify:CR=1 FL=1
MTEPTETIRFKQQMLNQILQEACQDGRFTTAILASPEGFLIAAAPQALTSDAETIAAMVAYLRDAAQRARAQLGLARLDEVTIRDQEGHLMVCRPFVAGEQDELILLVTAPWRQAYRRLTNIAILQICDIW